MASQVFVNSMHSFPSPAGVLIFYVCNYLGPFYNVQYMCCIYCLVSMLMGEGVLGFFFLYSEHYSWGVGEEQPCSQNPLPRGTRAPPLTLCIPQSHENWRSHVLMSSKCLSDKIWLLTFGVLSFHLAFALFFFLTGLWVHQRSKFILYQNILFTYILYLFYSLPQLDVFIWMLFQGPWLYFGNERLCALVFNFKTVMSFPCALFSHAQNSIVLGEIHFDSVPVTFFST